jgi:hypothetical protein
VGEAVGEVDGEAVGDGAPSAALGPWRSIDDLAALVGAYCWLEHRLFELSGRWATEPGARDGSELTLHGARDGSEVIVAECRVWCAASSRRHGALAGRWAERLPVRAGVDPAALMIAPDGPVATALEELGAMKAVSGFRHLVETVLPWLGAVYAAHLGRASAVSEAPVMEVLVEARHAAAGEIRRGQSLLQRLPASAQTSRQIRTAFERALTGQGIFPAARPS